MFHRTYLFLCFYFPEITFPKKSSCESNQTPKINIALSKWLVYSIQTNPLQFLYIHLWLRGLHRMKRNYCHGFFFCKFIFMKFNIALVSARPTWYFVSIYIFIILIYIYIMFWLPFFFIQTVRQIYHCGLISAVKKICSINTIRYRGLPPCWIWKTWVYSTLFASFSMKASWRLSGSPSEM